MNFKFKIFLVILFINIYFVGCASVPTKKFVEDEKSLKSLCEYYQIHWRWDSMSQVVILRKNAKEAKALVGSDVVVIGNQKVILSAPIERVKSTIIVPVDFREKIIKALVDQVSVKIARFQKIIIDVGHGGKDPGAVGVTGTYEKHIVLDIAKRLKGNLESKGIKVLVTRDSDKFLSLEERAQIASQSKADLFISIHANSSPVRSLYGLEVYSLRPLTFKEKTDPQREASCKLLLKQLAMKQDSVDLKNVVEDMLFTYKQYESIALASYIAEYTSHKLQTRNLGQKESGFFVLRNTFIPAVLIEVGFLSNPKEEKLLKTESYRQDIADALTESIINYANL